MNTVVKNPCTIVGCGQKVSGNGLCSMHWQRKKKHGHPGEAGRRRPEFRAPLKWIQAHVNHEGEDCLPWPYGKAETGYGRLNVGGDDWYAHRYILTLRKGPAPTPSHEAAHTCGKGHLGCTNPNHLEWKTHVENEADKKLHDTMPIGSRCSWAKLSEQEVDEIRQTKNQTLAALGEKYGVSFSLISQIKRGKIWKHIIEEAA